MCETVRVKPKCSGDPRMLEVPGCGISAKESHSSEWSQLKRKAMWAAKGPEGRATQACWSSRHDTTCSGAGHGAINFLFALLSFSLSLVIFLLSMSASLLLRLRLFILCYCVLEACNLFWFYRASELKDYLDSQNRLLQMDQMHFSL
jgi:hypothetical protein